MKTFFVSSTFRDMQFERDAISEITLPMLNEVAKKYGQTVSFCDLRWGIDTSDLDSDGSSKKVLNVCFDQIDRSSSPMVIILGERYGYIPSSDIISEAAAYRKLRLDDLKMSVTALEIEYGVFSEFAKSGALFYFREAEDVPQSYLAEDLEHAAKLAALKQRITELTGDKLKTYKVKFVDGKLEGVTEFAATLAHDLEEALLPEWKAEAGMTAFERDRKIQWNYIHDRAATFRGWEELVATVLGKIKSERLVVVKGAAGSGKSELFSKLAVSLDKSGYDVLPFVGGLTTESNDSFDIIRNTVVYLEKKLGITAARGGFGDSGDKHKFPEWRARCAELVKRYCAAGNKLIIMADAVDRLFSDEYRHSLAFIPDVTVDGFCFFATCLDTFKELDSGCVRLGELGEVDRRAVIGGALERYGRELDESVMSAMLGLPGAGNPQYLGFLIKRLMMMNRDDYDEINRCGGTMADISARQLRIVSASPSTVDGMCAMLLDEASKRINEPLLTDVLRLLACSRFGLRESDLRGIIGDKWNMLDFLHFVSYMGDCFIMRDDGRYDFSHASIRDGIMKNVDERAHNARILAYFKSVPNDPVSRDEICYHAIKADDKAYFREFIRGLCAEHEGETDEWMIPYLKSIYEFAYDDGGKWLKSAIADAPASADSVGFLKIMQLMGTYCLLTYSAIDVGFEICLECIAAAQRLTEAKVDGGEELLMNAQSGVSSASLMRGDAAGAGDISGQVYAAAKDMYDRNGDDRSFFVYLQAVRLDTITKLAAAQAGCKVDTDKLAELTTRALAEAEKRFGANPSAATAAHLYFALLVRCVQCVVEYDCEEAADLADRAQNVISPYLADLGTSQDYNTVTEIANTFATVGMKLCQAAMGMLASLQYDVETQTELEYELARLKQVIFTLYDVAYSASKVAYEKTPTADWAANYCWMMLNKCSVYFLSEDMAEAESALTEVLRVIDRIRRQDYTITIKSAAVKAKSLLATCLIVQNKRTDYARRLLTDTLPEAENILGSDVIGAVKNAAVELYISVLNLYLFNRAIDLATARATFDKMLYYARTDLMVRDLFSPLEYTYCSAMLAAIDADGDASDPATVKTVRTTKDYAKERLDNGAFAMIAVMLTADEWLFDAVIDALDEAPQPERARLTAEAADLGAEMFYIADNLVDSISGGGCAPVTFDTDGMFDSLPNTVEKMLELMSDTPGACAKLREDASRTFFKIYELTGDDTYYELASKMRE